MKFPEINNQDNILQESKIVTLRQSLDETKIKDSLITMNQKKSEQKNTIQEIHPIINQKYTSEFNSSNTYKKRDNDSNKF